MRTYIGNIIRLSKICVVLIFNLKSQRLFIRKTIAIDIEKARKTNDNSLDEYDFKKIRDYYGYAVPAILGESYCLLRGKKMSEKERMAITYLGSLSGLFDDFFDKSNIPESDILSLVEHPEKMSPLNSNQQLFLQFYLKALENSADINRIKNYFLKVFNAQILSKKQLLEGIDKNEIEYITFEKGGVSFLFYRTIFSEHISEVESLLFYKLGALMQLENDIFDVYKDHKAGIKTLATTEKNIEDLRKHYHLLTDELFDIAKSTCFVEKNRTKFLRFTLLTICRGFVCLDMLQENQRLTHNEFLIDNYERKDLICDMEKPKNFFRTIKYYLKYEF